jgi:hypothetical protein
MCTVLGVNYMYYYNNFPYTISTLIILTFVGILLIYLIEIYLTIYPSRFTANNIESNNLNRAELAFQKWKQQ